MLKRFETDKRKNKKQEVLYDKHKENANGKNWNNNYWNS